MVGTETKGIGGPRLILSSLQEDQIELAEGEGGIHGLHASIYDAVLEQPGDEEVEASRLVIEEELLLWVESLPRLWQPAGLAPLRPGAPVVVLAHELEELGAGGGAVVVSGGVHHLPGEIALVGLEMRLNNAGMLVDGEQGVRADTASGGEAVRVGGEGSGEVGGEDEDVVVLQPPANLGGEEVAAAKPVGVRLEKWKAEGRRSTVVRGDDHETGRILRERADECQGEDGDVPHGLAEVLLRAGSDPRLWGVNEGERAVLATPEDVPPAARLSLIHVVFEHLLVVVGGVPQLGDGLVVFAPPHGEGLGLEHGWEGREQVGPRPRLVFGLRWGERGRWRARR